MQRIVILVKPFRFNVLGKYSISHWFLMIIVNRTPLHNVLLQFVRASNKNSISIFVKFISTRSKELQTAKTKQFLPNTKTIYGKRKIWLNVIWKNMTSHNRIVKIIFNYPIQSSPWCFTAWESVRDRVS